MLASLERDERLTAGLLGVFLATLAVVIAVDTLLAWVAWSAAMVAITGTALVLLNRSGSAE